MDSKQKKIIIGVLVGFVVVLSFVGVAMWIYGFISKDRVAKIFGIVTSFISPTFIFGFCVKFITNKLHLKKIDQLQQTHKEQIEEVLNKSGIKLSKIEKTKPQTIKITSEPYFEWNGFVFYLTNSHLYLEIPDLSHLGKNDKFILFNHAINELKEKFRKDLN